MRFIIRDDDLNYFNTPADIEKWYGEILGTGIPVSFSAIPFVKPSSDAWMPEFAKNMENKEYPISENKELVAYIRKNPNVEIMQHGCTHETMYEVFEYQQKSGLFEKTKRANVELQKAFGRPISIFVPPHDAISNHGIRVVEDSRMDILRGKGSKNFLVRWNYVSAVITMALYRISFPNKSRMPAYPFVVDFGLHKEAYGNRLSHDFKEMKLWLHRAHAQGADFIVVNHMYEPDGIPLEALKGLIEEARILGFTFAKASALFER